MAGFASAIAIACTVCAFVLLANRLRKPDFAAVEVTPASQDLATASAEIRVLTWNVGYAGLGQRAEFFADKGQALRSLSRQEIDAAADRIAATLTKQTRDIICLQETAAAGFLTRGVALRARLDLALAQMGQVYWADLKTVLAPAPLRLDHGMSTYARLQDRGCGVIALPQTTDFYFGCLKKYYVGLMSRYPVAQTGKDWVVINIHLSAFDKAGAVRSEQLVCLLAYARSQYAKGHYVIIGGDWNMRLCATEFAHTTDLAALDWLIDLPQPALPQGWKLAIDPRTPTVRTMQAPYRPGDTYTTIIDGFVVSPNVRARDVVTHDFGFAFTDHHPVEAVFTAVCAEADA